jgi:hypothetical protein
VNGFTLAVGSALAIFGQVLAPPVPREPGRSEQQIRALVRQLGDREFRRREAAQCALLREGMRILPVLDRLGPQEDAEIGRRVASLQGQIPSCKLVVVWQNKLRRVGDPLNGKSNLCLSGRVTLLGPPGTAAPAPDGVLRVRLYDHTAAGENGGPVPLEQWIYPPEVLRQHVKRSGKADKEAAHLQLALPWATYRPGTRKVSLTVRYESSQGPAVESRSPVFALEDPAPKGVSEPAKK